MDNIRFNDLANQPVSGKRKAAAPQSITSPAPQLANGPQSPAAEPIIDRPATTGIAQSSPATINIGGIPHMNLPDQKYPGPLSMAADAMAGTIGFIANAPFGNRAEERLAANRAELNNDTAEPNKSPKVATPAPIQAASGGAQVAANQGAADLTGRQAGYMVENNLRQFEDKGNGIVRQVGADGQTAFTNVGVGDVTDPAKKVPVNSYSGVADNESLSKANAIRQQLIDRQPTGGISVLPEQAAELNARMDSRGQISDLQEALRRVGTRTERTAIGQALQAAISGQNQMAIESMRGQNQQVSDQGRNAITMRGQDITAASDANKQAIEQQRLSIDAPYRQAQTAGQVQQNQQAAAISDLQQRVRAGDQQALETLRALNGKDRVTAHVVGGGQNELGQPQPQYLAITSADGRVSFHSPNQQQGAASADKIKADMQAGKISREEAIKQLKAMGYQ